MFKVLALAALVAAAAAPQIVRHATLREAAEHVNAANNGWTAADPVHRFGSLEDVATVCGTWTPGHPKYNASRAPVGDADRFPASDIPTEFNSKVHWANCSVDVMKKVTTYSNKKPQCTYSVC